MIRKFINNFLKISYTSPEKFGTPATTTWLITLMLEERDCKKEKENKL